MKFPDFKYCQYDQTKGGKPSIGDRVESCHLGVVEDGYYKGTLGGISDNSFYTGIIILDEMIDDMMAISLPYVCMRKMSKK